MEIIIAINTPRRMPVRILSITATPIVGNATSNDETTAMYCIIRSDMLSPVKIDPNTLSNFRSMQGGK